MRYTLLITATHASLGIALPHMGTMNIQSLAKVKAAVTPRNEHGNSTLRPNHFTWSPPQRGEARAPCPVLNTLCNHGFLPRSGRDITLEIFTKAIKDGLNIGQEASEQIFGLAQTANPTRDPVPGQETFNLDMLFVHNFVEHDGSLSRVDAVFDDQNQFDEDTFDNYISYYGDANEITIQANADARARHALDISKVNDAFSILPGQIDPIMGENAFMLMLWGHPNRPIANRSFYEYFFRNERLPVELGWSPPDVEVGATMGDVMQALTDQSPRDVPLYFNPGRPKVLPN